MLPNWLVKVVVTLDENILTEGDYHGRKTTGYPHSIS